ncbi:hypothetical protein [Halosimplex halobium]|uniref:hypothetical protein n=1 Tax=Halosimplex halobium TaxID=3396618 RepID=UPI003F579537
MDPDRFEPWASGTLAVAGAVLAVGSAYGAVALAETPLTLAAYVAAVVGFGVHAVAKVGHARAYAAGRRDAESVGGIDTTFFCFLGAVVLTTVPNVEPSWRPLFFAPAAFTVLLGVAGLLAGNRRVRERLGWETPE